MELDTTTRNIFTYVVRFSVESTVAAGDCCDCPVPTCSRTKRESAVTVEHFRGIQSWYVKICILQL